MGISTWHQLGVPHEFSGVGVLLFDPLLPWNRQIVLLDHEPGHWLRLQAHQLLFHIEREGLPKWIEYRLHSLRVKALGVYSTWD